MELSYLKSILPALLTGSVMTIELTLLGIIFGTLLGLAAAFGKISKNKIFNPVANFYSWIIRGTPLLLQLFFLYYGLPELNITLSPFTAAVIGLSLNQGAYLSETIRGGIESIDKGQTEAARALGMTPFQTMRRIILPQAYKRLIPPMGNEFIALLKDSSLVSVIAMTELMRTAEVQYSATAKPVETLLTAGILYLLMTTVFTMIFGKAERRFSIYE